MTKRNKNSRPPSPSKVAAMELELAATNRDLTLLKSVIAKHRRPGGVRLLGGWGHQPPLMLAVAHGWTEAIEPLVAAGPCLEAGCDQSSKLPGLTPLMLCAHMGSTSTGSLLLRLGACRDARNPEGHTATAIAAMAGCDDFIRMLAAAGADLDAVNIHGASVLMLATHFRKHAAVKALLDFGANAHAASPGGVSALHLAVDFATRGTHSPSLPMLVAAGAAVDAEDAQGETPLMRAIAGPWTESTQALLDAGADPLRLNSFGLSALDFANSNRYAANPAADLAIAWGERAILRQSARPAQPPSKPVRSL